MSLDLLVFRMEPPSESSSAFYVGNSNDRYAGVTYTSSRLTSLGSGVLTGVCSRVGRNCLNSRWHRKYDALCRDALCETIEALDNHRTILPNELTEFLSTYCLKRMIPDVKDALTRFGRYDFLYVCW